MPADPLKTGKILSSKTDIQVYIGGATGPISDYMFRKYIRAGMLARYDDGRWIAHTDNLDDFFRAYTRISMASALAQIPDDPDGGK